MFHHVPLKEVTGLTYNAWTTVKLSNYVAIPPTCSGVILQITDTGMGRIMVRKMGSTDSMSQYIRYQQCDSMVGVDADSQFQVFIQYPSTKVYIKGFTSSGVTFFTNGVYKGASVRNSWHDVVCAEAPSTATGLIFQHPVSYMESSMDFGVRMKGSTDNRVSKVYWGSGCYNVVVGCDASQTVQQYTSSTLYTGIRLIAYITADVAWNTNGVDKSTATTGSYVDLAALAVGPGSQILEVVSSAAYKFAARTKGDPTDLYFLANNHSWIVVGADASGVSEIKIENAGVDMYQIGVCAPPASRPIGNVGIGDFMLL